MYTLECKGGYVRQSTSGIHCVPIEKATVVNTSYLKEIKLLASSAKTAGLTDLRLVELIVTEGECIANL